ncbi:MAG: hypothetical protein QOJ42_8247 [Acidobacteriaceae bacterium]|nr:hypothetical protein [Acidobacteriaceae bacterium]
MQVQTRELVQGQPILSMAGGLFRHKLLFIGLLATVLSLVAAVTLMAKPQYRSEMKFLLENNRSNPAITPDRSAAPAPTEITEQQINSELEVLASEDVLGAVADPAWSALAVSQRTPAAMKQHEDRLNSFRKRLKIEPARKSNVIDVSYTAPSSREATETLERFSSAYLAHRKLLSRPHGTSDFFADEAHRYKDAWQQANRELVTFQQQNQLVSVQDTEQTLSKEIDGAEGDLRSNQASLAELNQRLAAGNKAVKRVPERQHTQQHTLLSQGSVDQMRTLLTQLQNRKTELLTRYTPADRLVVEVNREIADTSTALNAALAEKRMEDTTDVNPAWQGVNSSLVEGGIERQALIAQGESVQRSLADLRGRLARLQSLDVHFNGLQEQADQARSNFELFSEKRDQAQIEDAMDERELINIAVAESPTSLFRPVSPKPLLNGALGLLTALFLAAGAVYFAEYLRTTVATPRELEMSSRYPVLATVPYVAEADTAGDLAAPAERSRRTRVIRLSVPNMVSAVQNFGRAMKRDLSRNAEMYPEK